MTRQQAINSLYDYGMSEDQVNEIIDAIQAPFPNRKPYTRFKPCTCGANRRDRWYGNSRETGNPYVMLICKNCGMSVYGNNEEDAKRKWNEQIERMEHESQTDTKTPSRARCVG